MCRELLEHPDSESSLAGALDGPSIGCVEVQIRTHETRNDTRQHLSTSGAVVRVRSTAEETATLVSDSSGNISKCIVLKALSGTKVRVTLWPSVLHDTCMINPSPTGVGHRQRQWDEEVHHATRR